MALMALVFQLGESKMGSSGCFFATETMMSTSNCGLSWSQNDKTFKRSVFFFP